MTNCFVYFCNILHPRMYLSNFVLISVLLMIADGFTLRGPSGPLVAPLGSSVVLPCSVDELLSVKGLEVEWRRTDSETLVHLYQDGESQAESQQQDYQDRAHFFTDQIQHGNFSLRLDNLRAEDEGQYKCKVYIQQESGETVVQIKDVERLLVSGSDQHISASVGEDITLSCSVDSHIPTEHIEEVSWKKTDKNKNILVLVFQNNEILPDSSDEQYRDRVELFSAEIPKGNFSLRLKSVRTEDKGVYMCQVFAGDLSANATVTVEQMGFSASHIMMLILCISASGSALLLFCLIYCRSQNDARLLQMSLVICPNICLFIAFVLWCVTEGSLNETVACCALYFLRPLMLCSAAPYKIKFIGKTIPLMIEYFLFSTVVFTVLFKNAWEKNLNFAEFDRIMIIVLFVIVLLPWLFLIIYALALIFGKLSERISAIFRVLVELSFDVLPSLQFILLFYAFGSASGVFFIVAVLPVLTTVTNYNWDKTCGVNIGCSPLVRRSVWLMLMLLINAVMVFFYIMVLESDKDHSGWTFVIGFLQLLWTVWIFERSFDDTDIPTFVPVYLLGSVVLVVLNAGALMTELILKTINGEGALGDLKIIVFSSECLCLLSLLISLVLAPLIPQIRTCLQTCQNADPGSQHDQIPQTAAGSDESPATGSNKNQNSESHEIKPLMMKTEDQEAGASGDTHIINFDSLIKLS
ncbi:uncharacterized protein LOC132149702 isoform X1 [Carassius carassius]|uniref:uncharacterized protein LOC132149702 isoform X1 n=1 Tax=Carassius carassius TaxID=217509 RepID=UPI00286884B5|nr:uncharacterized protein LOC132149702 isoform X1 [Carassius carassius]